MHSSGVSEHVLCLWGTHGLGYMNAGHSAGSTGAA